MQLSTRRETRCARLGLGFRAPGSLANRSRTLPPHDVLPTRPASPSWHAGMCIYIYMLTLPPILYISKHYIESVQMCMCYTGSVLASRQAHAESLRCATPEQLWMRELEALRPVLQAAIERP